MTQAVVEGTMGSKQENRVLSLNDLVTQLRAIDAAAFTPEVVSGTFSGLVVDEASLAPYVRWRPKCYTRNLVYRNDLFELLVVCWESGSSSAIHDHAGQECLLYIHQGALGVDGFELVDPNCSGRTGEGVWIRRVERVSKLSPGLVDQRGPSNDIHRVANRRAFGSRAVSVHVYSRPIETCVVYDHAHGRAESRNMRYDSIEGREVAEPATCAPRGC